MAESKDPVTLKTIKGISGKSDEEILTVLKSISSSDMTTLNDNDVDCVTDLYDLLSSENSEVQTNAAKVVAEITKNSAQRLKFTDSKIVKKLLEIIAPTATDKTIQACRALGNIFYENSKARDLMDKEQDIKLYSLLDWKTENGLSEELEKQFVKTRCGLISNYLQSEEIAKRAVELKLVNKVQQILRECTEDKHDYLVLHVLPPLSILSEMIDITFDPPTTKLIIGILARSSNPDISEICLELLQCQAENDDFKYLLAKEGLCDILYDLLGKHKSDATTDETKSLMKSACDLIVQVLNGDDAMHHLYNTPFLANIEKWLDSYDIDLLIAAVLAIGNFARTDSHCIEFVERGIMKKLIEILSKNTSIDDDIRLQHALLSALRNLVIPKPNKVRLVSDGLIETILPMLEDHQPPVVFKLLGTLRMAIDGQERLAMELLQNDKLINQLVVWSKTVEYHPGVSAESLRLMAWLLKFAYKNTSTNPDKLTLDDTSIRKFVQVDDAVKSIVSMLLSNHLVMQNEALIALCILTVTLQSEANNETIKLDRLLIESDFGQKLADFITKNMDTMTKEIVENLHTLIRQLKQCEALETYLNQYKINELMNNIPSLTEYCTI